MARTVAIIGAGISGLATGKAFGDYGIDYTCFESSDRIGGNWAFGNPNGHSSAYRSLHIDTSRQTMSFRDMQMSDRYPFFPHHSQVKEYLEEYASAFDLKRNIEFENGVVHAEPTADGWELETQRTGTRHADVLVVANGHHWDPRMAEAALPFTGLTMHSHAYIDPKTPYDLSGKRILIIGIGNSAADIAVELSSRTLQNEVVISTRSSAWIVPKFMGGKPADTMYRTLPWVSTKLQRKFVQAMQPMTAGRPESYGLPVPNHKFFEAHPTQSVELPLRLGSGDLRAKGDFERVEGQTVHFADGTSEDFDVIIHATGYNITFPFFDPEFVSAPENVIRLYKRIFKPGVDRLAFVGFGQATPTLFPWVECQARCVASWLIGEYALPSVDEMERVIDADTAKYTSHMVQRPRHTQQLDYFLYEHQMRTEELPAGRMRAHA